MNSEPIVFIVDDDKWARDSVRALVTSIGLASESFDSAEDFLDNFDREQSGCVVCDLRMPGLSGVELQRQLLLDGISLPMILVTAHAETRVTVEAVKTGAVTVVEKPYRDFELIAAIRAAFSLDEQFREHSAKYKVLSERFNQLTEKEKVVLDFMVDGVANKVMARRLGVTMRAIERRRQRIFEKTCTDSLAELIRMVAELGQLDSADHSRLPGASQQQTPSSDPV